MNNSYLYDQPKPRLMMIYSKYSDQSENDLEKSPKLLKLQKLNSAFELNENQAQIRYSESEDNKEESRNTYQQKWQPCSCTKTNCLKMYCSCFHNGQRCGEMCKCEECQNTDQYMDQRDKAVEYIKKKAHRNKKVPQEKLFETQDIWGCNCLKTRCIKRYCECYIRQKHCTVECNCTHCENGKDEDLYNEIKRQNQEPQHKKRDRSKRLYSN